MSGFEGLPRYEDIDTTMDNSISPTKTYRIDFNHHRILGKIEEGDTVMQFVRKALSTDKYTHEIYDWYYGHELSGLINKPFEFICSEIPRIIDECLKTDDRIIETKDYVFEKTAIDRMTVSFTVVSVYSEQRVTTEVPV